MHSQRLLSQVDRDPDSPTYGCLDRNFWNYKIRDFASIIQQQGILVLDVLYSYDIEENVYKGNAVIRSLIKGGVEFWARSQLQTGAFNEYYPNESGFPPTAFSLYAVSLILKKYPEFQSELVTKTIIKAVKWLLKHPEKEALNQESAALAGIAIAQTLTGVLVDKKKFEVRLQQFYDAQHQEGWFDEYGGPDLGYLSVTIDSLWDIFKITKDERALHALTNAVDFISQFLTVSNDFPVMINSRNTDYLVPYGLSGFGSMNKKAANLCRVLYSNFTSSAHILHKTDDRYLTHYIGQSYFRGILNISSVLKDAIPMPRDEQYTTYLAGCKIFISHTSDKSIIVSLKKGGIVNVFDNDGIYKADYGWRAKIKNRMAVTHWQNDEYNCSYAISDDQMLLSVRGYFSLHKYVRPSVGGHIVLRILSFFLGNRIMRWLKTLLIFSSKNSGLEFRREISIQKTQVQVKDTFVSKNKKYIIYEAPHYSLRHVSSAGRFVDEELIAEQEIVTLSGTGSSLFNIQL